MILEEVFVKTESQVKIYTICTSKTNQWWKGELWDSHDERGDVFVRGNEGLTKLYQLKAIYVEEKKISFCFSFCVFYKFYFFFAEYTHLYLVRSSSFCPGFSFLYLQKLET